MRGERKEWSACYIILPKPRFTYYSLMVLCGVSSLRHGQAVTNKKGVIQKSSSCFPETPLVLNHGGLPVYMEAYPSFNFSFEAPT